MKIVIYTIPGCSYCTKVKEIMARANLEYEHISVGTDISREQLIKEQPLAKGFPYVMIDGERIGGMTETAKYLLDKGIISPRKKNG